MRTDGFGAPRQPALFPTCKLPASGKLAAALLLVVAVALMPRRPDAIYGVPAVILAAV